MWYGKYLSRNTFQGFHPALSEVAARNSGSTTVSPEAQIAVEMPEF